MKKLFSLGFGFLLLLSVSACTPRVDVTVYDEQIVSLERQIEQLETENKALSDALSEYEQTVGSLTFVIESDPPMVRTIAIQDTEDQDPFTLLVESVGPQNIAYQESEFGLFINSIATITPRYGSYIHIEKNNEALAVGLDEATYEDGDVFRFSLVYWDPQAQTVATSLERFLENEATQFVNVYNYDVLTALSILGEPADATYVAASESEAGYLKDVLILRALNQDATRSLNQLAASLTTDNLFRASIATMALTGTDHYPSAQNALQDRANQTALNTVTFDDLSAVIMALKGETPDEFIAAFNAQLSQLDNAPSLAFAIMALIALEQNPYDVMHTMNQPLPDVLLSLQTIDGGFLYGFNSGPGDTQQFSSPQSFLALSVLDAFLNGDIVVPYEPE